MRNLTKLISFLMFVFLGQSAYADQAAEQELVELYGALLEDHTREGRDDGLPVRLVDYPALSGDDRWPELVGLVASYPAANLTSQEQRKAFYLNAYNILAMNMVLDNWPLRSLRSVGSLVKPVWKHDAGVVAGQEVTLSYLEHEVLRGLGDPRVHMAINCASLSCPDLRHEPYRSAVIDQQLDEQVTRFLKQAHKGILIDTKNQKVRLSSIFDWFEEDFESAGGVEQFVRRYRNDLPDTFVVTADLPYNWGINGKLSAHTLRAMRDEF